jgi:hypothetical protein
MKVVLIWRIVRLAADSVYLVDTKLSAQDVLTTRHDKLPPT